MLVFGRARPGAHAQKAGGGKIGVNGVEQDSGMESEIGQGSGLE